MTRAAALASRPLVSDEGGGAQPPSPRQGAPRITEKSAGAAGLSTGHGGTRVVAAHLDDLTRRRSRSSILGQGGDAPAHARVAAALLLPRNGPRELRPLAAVFIAPVTVDSMGIW
jgi:hypothetical protein